MLSINQRNYQRAKFNRNTNIKKAIYGTDKMINLNKTTLSGFLTKNPQIIKIGDKKSVCKARIAYNGLPYFTKEGDKKRDTIFIDIEVWGKSGDSLAQHAQKGSALLVEGELRQSEWTDDEGKRHSRDFIRVIRWQFVLPKKAKTATSNSKKPRQKTLATAEK